MGWNGGLNEIGERGGQKKGGPKKGNNGRAPTLPLSSFPLVQGCDDGPAAAGVVAGVAAGVAAAAGVRGTPAIRAVGAVPPGPSAPAGALPAPPWADRPLACRGEGDGGGGGGGGREAHAIRGNKSTCRGKQ